MTDYEDFKHQHELVTETIAKDRIVALFRSTKEGTKEYLAARFRLNGEFRAGAWHGRKNAAQKRCEKMLTEYQRPE